MSFFDSLNLLQPDPIFGLTDAFAADRRFNKVNLGAGTYKDAKGAPFVLSCVKAAEAQILGLNLNKEYLPISGDRAYLAESLKLIIGEELGAKLGGNVFGVQTIGGTSALRMGAECLIQAGHKKIFLPNPTWPNHLNIFTRAGMLVHTYPYYDAKKRQIDFPALTQAVQDMQAGDVIILHACCHNPTGLDPSMEQWKELSALIKTQKVFPFFDLAYLGFGSGLDVDAQPVRHFAEQGHEMFIGLSYSKNFGLYGERIGALAMVAKTPEIALKTESHLKSLIRANYSNPPLHGERIITTILQSNLKQVWIDELGSMRQRIEEMRRALVEGLTKCSTLVDYSFIGQQKGMFSFTGLQPEEVQRLRVEYGIYMPADGRINVAGLNPQNIDYVMGALANTLQKTPR